MNYKNVQDAIGILISELEKIIDQTNDNIKQALEKLDYLELEILSKKAKEIKDFLTTIKKLNKEWNSISVRLSSTKTSKKSKTIKEKLKKGLRTPEEAYYRPILESLVELGGSGKVEVVLKMIKEKMEGILNKYDWMPLPSMPKIPRWKNTAQWARAKLIKDGFISPNSPEGIWEITEAGREFLKK